MRADDIDLAKLLIQKIKSSSYAGDTLSDELPAVFYSAVQKNYLQVADLLRVHIGSSIINFRDQDFNNLMHAAAYFADSLNFVLDRVFTRDAALALANAKNDNGQLPIQIALDHDNSAFKRLLQITRNLHLTTDQQLKVLAHAITERDVELLDKLLLLSVAIAQHLAIPLIKDVLKITVDIFVKVQTIPSLNLMQFEPATQFELIETSLQHRNEITQFIVSNVVPQLPNETKVKVAKILLKEDYASFQQIVSSSDEDFQELVMHCVLEKHNEEAAKFLLNRGVRAPQPWTACHNGECRFSSLILSNITENGTTPLTIAIQNGDVKRVDELLSRGASPNIANDDGSFPIHFLGEFSILRDVLPKLLAHGADINQLDKHGNSILHRVAADRNMVRYLIQKKAELKENLIGPKPNEVSNACLYLNMLIEPSTMFDVISKAEQNIDVSDEFSIILEDYPDKTKVLDKKQRNLLRAACEARKYQLAKLLLERGVEVQKPLDYCQDTATRSVLELFTCNDQGVTTICQRWEDHQCDIFSKYDLTKQLIHLRNKDNSTLLHYIAREAKNCDCIDRVLKLEPNLVLQDNTGNTPIHQAVIKNNIKVLKKLLDQLQDTNALNIRNTLGQTALHIAAQDGSKEIVELLAEKNSSILIRDNDFKIPLVYRLEKDTVDDKLIELLSPAEGKNVKFDDIVGLDFAKQRLQLIIEVYKNPKKCQIYGVKIPKTVLFEGPPGVGKTMVARAFSNELSALTKNTWGFERLNASEFNQSTLGKGATLLTQRFDEAFKNSPCVLFFDEVDSIAGIDRSNTRYDAGNENKRVLNCLLELINKLEMTNKAVILIAATNLPDSLDKAFLDRFQERIVFKNPDPTERTKIFQHLFDRVPCLNITSDLPEALTKQTEGLSIRQLKALVENGCRIAWRQSPPATDEHFVEALQQMKRATLN